MIRIYVVRILRCISYVAATLASNIELTAKLRALSRNAENRRAIEAEFRDEYMRGLEEAVRRTESVNHLRIVR